MACSQVWGAPGAGDCSGTCAGAEVACCEPEGSAATSQWVYKGAPPSGFAPSINYMQVGEGGGDWRQELMTTSWGWKPRKCCLWLLAVALLLPISCFSMMLMQNSPHEAETGSESLVTVSSMPFDCSDGDLWSLAKNNWCCARFGRGCTTTTTPRRQPPHPPPPPPHPPTPPPPPRAQLTSLPFDCNLDFVDCYHCLLTRWSAGKRAWCCAHARRGCAPLAQSPAQPLAQPPQVRVERVPVPVPVPAPAPTPCPLPNCAGPCPPLDCNVGLNNWKNAWGPEKKVWCCQHAGKGCA